MNFLIIVAISVEIAFHLFELVHTVIHTDDIYNRSRQNHAKTFFICTETGIRTCFSLNSSKRDIHLEF